MLAPPSVCDSAVAPCLPGCLAFLQRHSPLRSPSSCPLGCLPAVNSSPHPGISLQSLCSSSQLHILVDLCPCPWYVGPWHGLSVWFSLHSDCHRLAVYPLKASNAFSLSQLIAHWGSPPCCSSHTARAQVQFTHSPPLFPLLPSFYHVLCVSVYSFLVAKDSCQLSAGAL